MFCTCLNSKMRVALLLTACVRPLKDSCTGGTIGAHRSSYFCALYVRESWRLWGKCLRKCFYPRNRGYSRPATAQISWWKWQPTGTRLVIQQLRRVCNCCNLITPKSANCQRKPAGGNLRRTTYTEKPYIVRYP